MEQSNANGYRQKPDACGHDWRGAFVKTAVVVPTLNPGKSWLEWVKGMASQVPAVEKLIIIDSSSTDGYVDKTALQNVQIKKISKAEFDHGGTRQLGVELAGDVDVVVFLTQDAILTRPDSIRLLLKAFDDPKVGVAHGRQLPRPGAKAIEAHARLFNYPDADKVNSFDDRLHVGMKAAFCSNSFSAYRKTALQAIGGFPVGNIFGEDMYVAAKLLMAGWLSAYVGKATVYHSHNYTMAEEVRRYFDVGVFHSRNKWLLDNFGRPNGEGKKFVLSELRYVAGNSPLQLPSAIMRTGLKFAGYKAGLSEATLPLKIKQRLSMNKVFWKTSKDMR